jgi:ABC-type glycerol-3-phosphate transport system substrate-binding protein
LVLLTLLVVVATVAACAPKPTEAPTQAPVEPTEPPTEEAVPAGELDLANLSPDIPDPTEPVVVTFASWVGGGEGWQNLAAQFHEMHPNITIEFQDVPFEEIRTKLLTQVAANNPPDVAYVDAGTNGEFASRNALLALDDYIAMSKAVDPQDYVEAFMLSAKFENKIYGLPIDGESTGLFYRTDLFEAASITAPPATWDELLADAQKLTQPDKKQYGYILFAPESAYYWYPFLWQAGGDTLAQDGVDVIWDSEAGQRAAEFYVGLREYSPPDFFNSNSWDGRVAFAEGTVAMYMAGAWFAGVLQNEFPDVEGKWATAPLPSDERCATTIAGDNLVIFKATKHPEAAWKWVEFISAPQNMALLNLGTPEAPTTLLPPRKSLLDDPRTFETNPILKGFAENMKCAVISTVVQPRWGEAETLLNDALARAIYGEVDATTAIVEAAQEAEALLKQ